MAARLIPEGISIADSFVCECVGFCEFLIVTARIVLIDKPLLDRSVPDDPFVDVGSARTLATQVSIHSLSALPLVEKGIR